MKEFLCMREKKEGMNQEDEAAEEASQPAPMILVILLIHGWLCASSAAPPGQKSLAADCKVAFTRARQGI